MDKLRQGLSEKEVAFRLQRYGENTIRINETKRIFRILWDVVKEPMFLLLVAACVLYFVLGENAEGLMMVAALGFVGAISLFQEIKSSGALAALQQLAESKVKVIRDGVEKQVASEKLVPGDIIILTEGEKVPADAIVIQENDLSINESIITGESLPVEKNTSETSNKIFQGTVINSGRCIADVIATGSETTLGKIGKSIITYSESKTELQRQVDVFVRRFAVFGISAFAIIFLVNYLHSKDVITSLLFGLTLAMSAIPEEIPVAFSSFMALGAYHMSKLGIITRQPQTIENLGAVNTICLDKTGTITENRMKVDTLYDYETNTLLKLSEVSIAGKEVLYYGVLASEQNPFDTMEQAIVEAYTGAGEALPQLKMTNEYALHGHPPMMTHVYEQDDFHLVAAKGAVERIVRICQLDESEAAKILRHAKVLAGKGQRVLGVAGAQHRGNHLPANQDDFAWKFIGLISLYDPPKAYVRDVFRQFYDAGISVKLLTGDFPETAITIAEETGLRSPKTYVTGEEIMKASDGELNLLLESTNIFARMYPEAKLKAVNALMKNENIVAMTGDGVNDGPALKAANIGIAMGKKGTEVARQSADLIVTDDDLRKIAEAVRQGRKIFNNIKKAIRYIISIHIPIILTASVPLLLGWKFPNIFTPIHIIFLELIMGPTCSIFYEREPVEEYIMKIAPRKKDAWLFEGNEFLISTVQGLIIAAGILVLYYSYMQQGYSLTEVRTIVFTSLLMSNIFLTFANRSFNETFLKTVRYRNNLALPVLVISVCFLAIIHFVPYIRSLFGMRIISVTDFCISLLTALVSVIWFEFYKANLTTPVPAVRTDHKHAF